jgi:hypothetical protein
MPSDSPTSANGSDGKLVGSRGAAEMLGVTDAAIRKLVSRGRFPPADVLLDGRRLWCRTTIERYDAVHRRRPGRPRKSLVADTLQQQVG